MSINLDPDRAQCEVRPGLAPNCLQRLSAEGTSKHRVNQVTAKGLLTHKAPLIICSRGEFKVLSLFQK